MIKQYRRDQKLSLRALSAQTGISCALLCDIENSKAPVTAKTAQKLAKAMGIKKWWVLVSEGEQQ